MKTLKNLGEFMRLARAIAAVLGATAVASATAGVATFDSVSEFSGVQGAGGWFYGYYATAGDASSFMQLSSFRNDTWWESDSAPSPWTLLNAGGGHPSLNPAEHWAVRRWVSGAAGTLSLSGEFQASDFGTAAVHVLIDGVEKFTSAAGVLTPFVLSNLAVNLGSTVDFAIDAYDGNQDGDSTRFTALGQVSTGAVPEPSSAALVLAGALAGAISMRRRRAG